MEFWAPRVFYKHKELEKEIERREGERRERREGEEEGLCVGWLSSVEAGAWALCWELQAAASSEG